MSKLVYIFLIFVIFGLFSSSAFAAPPGFEAYTFKEVLVSLFATDSGTTGNSSAFAFIHWSLFGQPFLLPPPPPPPTSPPPPLAGTTWTGISGGLKHISVNSVGQVWGVNAGDAIFFREGITSSSPKGTGWTQISGGLKQLDVGTISGNTVVWGINVTAKTLFFQIITGLTGQGGNVNIFFRDGITASNPKGTGWIGISGGLTNISVGPNGQVWGVNINDDIFFRDGISSSNPKGTGWTGIAGKLRQLDVGSIGGNTVVWGVNINDDIFFRDGISSSNPKGTGWTGIAGKLKHISVNSVGQVWGVNINDDIFFRDGISSSNPKGTGWTGIAGKLKQLDVGSIGGNTVVWGVNSGDAIFFREGIAVTAPTPTPAPTCTDTDNSPDLFGLNLTSDQIYAEHRKSGDVYVKGNIKAEDVNGNYFDVDDACEVKRDLLRVTSTDAESVREHLCRDKYFAYTIVPCEFGCQDGACNPAPTPTLPAPPPPPPPAPTSTCTDTDGGLNYEEYGIIYGISVTGAQYRESDDCSVDGNTLIESFCEVNNPRSRTYDCPYGCSNGACRLTPPPPANYLLDVNISPAVQEGIAVIGPGIRCGMGATDCSESFTSGTDVTLTAFLEIPEHIIIWSGCDSVTNTSCTLAMNADKAISLNVIAVGLPPPPVITTYSLTVDIIGKGNGRIVSDLVGIDCGRARSMDCSDTWPSGTRVTLTAEADAGSKFAGWSGCNRAIYSSCTVTVDADKTVTARFDLPLPKPAPRTPPPPPPPAPVVIPPPPTNLSAVCNNDATRVTLSWNPVSGAAKYQLRLDNTTNNSSNCVDNWFCDDPPDKIVNDFTSTTYTADIVSDQSYNWWVHSSNAGGTSKSERQRFICSAIPPPPPPLTTYSLTVTKSGTGNGMVTSSLVFPFTGIYCETDCFTASVSYPSDASVVVIAEADDDSEFVGWSGCDSVENSNCTLTLNADKSVTAEFNPSRLNFFLRLLRLFGLY